MWHVVTPRRHKGARSWESSIVHEEAQDKQSPIKAVDQQWPDDDEVENETLSISKESLAPNWLRGV
eukprot:5456572-Karenia_brevis.AAC.1